MLARITSFFDNCLKLGNAEAETTTTDKLHLACAALLMELTLADQQVDTSEQQKLREILHHTFNLSEEQLNTLWQLAEEEARSATSLFQFTSLINSSYGYSEKLRLLHDMWLVAWADGRIDRYEEHLIRKVTDLLYLSHGDFIRAKLASRPE